MSDVERAEVSADYINSHLEFHYRVAKRRTEKGPSNGKPADSDTQLGTCLFEYYGSTEVTVNGSADPKSTFYVQFGVPKIEFICNHEAILFLDLQKGYFVHGSQA